MFVNRKAPEASGIYFARTEKVISASDNWKFLERLTVFTDDILSRISSIESECGSSEEDPPHRPQGLKAQELRHADPIRSDPPRTVAPERPRGNAHRGRDGDKAPTVRARFRFRSPSSESVLVVGSPVWSGFRCAKERRPHLPPARTCAKLHSPRVAALIKCPCGTGRRLVRRVQNDSFVQFPTK